MATKSFGFHHYQIASVYSNKDLEPCNPVSGNFPLLCVWKRPWLSSFFSHCGVVGWFWAGVYFMFLFSCMVLAASSEALAFLIVEMMAVKFTRKGFCSLLDATGPELLSPNHSAFLGLAVVTPPTFMTLKVFEVLCM